MYDRDHSSLRGNRGDDVDDGRVPLLDLSINVKIQRGRPQPINSWHARYLFWMSSQVEAGRYPAAFVLWKRSHGFVDPFFVDGVAFARATMEAPRRFKTSVPPDLRLILLTWCLHSFVFAHAGVEMMNYAWRWDYECVVCYKCSEIATSVWRHSMWESHLNRMSYRYVWSKKIADSAVIQTFRWLRSCETSW